MYAQVDYIEREREQTLRDFYEVIMLVLVILMSIPAILNILSIIDNQTMISMFLVMVLTWIIIVIGGIIKIKYG